MSNDSIDIEYNTSLKPLEDLLSNVNRPGNFFARGSKELPLPKIEIDGVGSLSFPIPKDQIKTIIEQATQAPYGRGAETILDTSVRKTWQLGPESVKITGKSWKTNFDAILSEVKNGLGCQEMTVTAELYKLLIYDKGGFFHAHRDSEKAPGMFGTLVVVVPSAHRGGELVVRHAGHEEVLDLSDAEASELTFGAFYADCEHEVLPVTEGYRVCLVYNLIQQKGQQRICAPLYDEEVSTAAEILEMAFTADDSPAKIAWLLEHQYTQAELSFATLKNADAALAKVLAEAASRAKCALHLGIVHIEESGSAEPNYDHYSSRSRWRDYDDDEEDISNDEFEVIDVEQQEQYVDGWINQQNLPMDFGRLPIEEGELLPAGSLDDEDPDEQRLLEATGNAGVSYERAYHRAALVIWRNENYINVLLQSGIHAALTYFKERVESRPERFSSDAWRTEMCSLASAILDAWESIHPQRMYTIREKYKNSSEMLQSLCCIKDSQLLERFIRNIVVQNYDGSENSALIKAMDLLETNTFSELVMSLISERMWICHAHCVNLLSSLVDKISNNSEQKRAILDITKTVIGNLKKVSKNPNTNNFRDIYQMRETKELTPNSVVELWDTLKKLDSPDLLNITVTEMIAYPEVFCPRKVLSPALSTLYRYNGKTLNSDIEFMRLIEHVSVALLLKSEHPIQPPKDWRQEVAISCKCEDCQQLQVFVRNPKEQIHYFRVRKDRRQHLHNTIEAHKLDMTHLTERQGSPQTLVCTKTRRGYEQSREYYFNDIVEMEALASILCNFPKEAPAANLYSRLAEAINRAKKIT